MRRMEKKQKKQKWHQDELSLLAQIYPLYTSKKWKQIAEAFKKQGYNRSEIQCREKWINFLDPELNKTEWEEEELQKMFEIHQQVGTKWCVISKYIGRTQNKIKNRFYGTLRNYIRFVIAHLNGNTRSFNYEIGKLPPNFLNDIYRGQNQLKFLGKEVKNTIYGMKYKVDRDFLTQRIELKPNLYQKLLTIVLKAFTFISKKAEQRRPQEEREIQQDNQESEEEGQQIEEEQKVEQIVIIKKETEVEVFQVMPEVKKEQLEEQNPQPVRYEIQMVREWPEMYPSPNFFPFWNPIYPNPCYNPWPQ